MPKRTSTARKNGKAADEERSPIGHNSGYKSSRHNATKYGIFSERDVLEWEDEEEFKELHEALIEDFEPVGRSETERVKDLARIEVRRKRLRIAEHAAINDGLREAVADRWRTANAAVAYLGHQFKEGENVDLDGAFWHPDDFKLSEKLRTYEATRDVLFTVDQLNDIARAGLGDDDKEVRACVEHLPAGMAKEVWKALEEEGLIVVEWFDSKALAIDHFIKTVVFPRIERAHGGLAAREKIPYQAIGSALFSDELQKLLRYETHLDRKYERTLAILFRLQEIRDTRERKKLGRRGE